MNKLPIKTGLLFGSFNPIHIGHLVIAEYMKEFIGIDEIIFIVSPQNPHKCPEQLASPAARLQMVRLAIEEYSAFRASDIEFTMPLPSYTIDTLQNLSETLPGRDLHIIIGTDNIQSIGIWKGAKTLLKDYKFLFYPRLNTDSSRLTLFSKATLVNAPVIEISSSFIRRSLMEGRDMRAFIPPGTYDYIIKNRIYL